MKGAVEAPGPDQALNLLLRRIVGKKGVYRASREMRETEDDERDGEQRDQGLQKADCKETAHVRSGAVSSAARDPDGRGARPSGSRPPFSGVRLLTAGGYSAAAIR